jgi:hypothetical protein
LPHFQRATLRRLWLVFATLLVTCFFAQALRHVYGQDATDDERGAYELYANGRVVAVGAGCDSAWREEERRLERFLSPGRNLIALHAPRCGGDPGPFVFAEMRLAQRWPP